jgi:hypothetical protein
MFRVKVTGEYIARSPVSEKEKIKRVYEIEGNIPTANGALSIVKNKLLVPALTKKYPDYVSYLTHHIVELIPLDEKSAAEMSQAEVSYMDRDRLLRYIKENALGVDARYYPDLFKLREAVKLAKEDPKGYAAQFALREPDLRLDLEMAACNPQLFQPQETPEDGGLVATISISDKPKALLKTANIKQTEDRLAGLRADQIRDGEMGPIDEAPDAGDL